MKMKKIAFGGITPVIYYCITIIANIAAIFIIVLPRLADLGKTLLEDELPLPHGEQIHLDATHKNGGGNEIQPLVGGVADVGGELLLSLDGGVEILPALVEAQGGLLVEVGQGEVHLHVTVDEQYFLALGDHAVSHVGAGGGLAASTLVVGEADDLCLCLAHARTPFLKVLWNSKSVFQYEFLESGFVPRLPKSQWEGTHGECRNPSVRQYVNTWHKTLSESFGRFLRTLSKKGS